MTKSLTNLSGVERIRAEAFEQAAKVCDRQRCAAAAKAIRALALPSEPPSQATRYPADGGLGEQKQPLDEAFSGFDMLRDRFAPPSQGDVEGRANVSASNLEARVTEYLRDAMVEAGWSDHGDQNAIRNGSRDSEWYGQHPARIALRRALASKAVMSEIELSEETWVALREAVAGRIREDAARSALAKEDGRS